jgi:AraC-like DNA-binding protein
VSDTDADRDARDTPPIATPIGPAPLAGAIFQPPDIPERQPGWAWTHRPQFWRPRHHHGELEFNLVLAGSAVMEIAGRRRNVVRNDLVWLSPGIDHALLTASPDFDMWVVAFRPEVVDRVRGGQSLDPLAGVPQTLQPARLPAHAVTEISQRCATIQPGASRDASALVHALIVAGRATQLEDQRDAGAVASGHPGVQRCLRLLRDDPTLDRLALAQATGASPSLLAHRFKRALGVSIPEYRARTRLHLVMAMVGGGQRNLTHAAHQAGFGSYAQFHRVVQAMTGLSPRRAFSETGRRLLMGKAVVAR